MVRYDNERGRGDHRHLRDESTRYSFSTPDRLLADFARDISRWIAFATPELLWRVLTAKRWELLKVMSGAGSMSIREAARRVGRDVKAVHADVTALLDTGILDRTAGGGVEFPYQTIKVEFVLQAA
jgi:predicted transcriptional regulator